MPALHCSQTLPCETQKHVQVRAARGQIWKRRPSQWLRGMDGQLDFNFAVYLHEGQAEKVGRGSGDRASIAGIHLGAGAPQTVPCSMHGSGTMQLGLASHWG
jgi:hypothetical protein